MGSGEGGGGAGGLQSQRLWERHTSDIRTQGWQTLSAEAKKSKNIEPVQF